MELFLKSLKIISNHPIEGDIYYSKWEESLKNYKEIEFNLHTILRIKHLKLIFNNCVINPDLILKLLYK